jgi:hypothetical protein
VRLVLSLLLIVVPALLYVRALERGWIAAAVELGIGLALLPLILRSRTNARFAVNAVSGAIGAWIIVLYVYLAFNPLD